MKPTFFETIKAHDGVLLNLPFHAERMCRTVREFYPVIKAPSLDDIAVPHEFSRGLYKCRVTYSYRIENVEYEPYTRKPISSIDVVDGQGIRYPWKSCDREALSRLVALSGFDEVIIARDGFVTDTSFSNLVFENGDGLFTPATFLLNGTKRQALLKNGVIRERDIRVKNLHRYGGVILINAMLDINDGHRFTISQTPGGSPLFMAE